MWTERTGSDAPVLRVSPAPTAVSTLMSARLHPALRARLALMVSQNFPATAHPAAPVYAVN